MSNEEEPTEETPRKIQHIDITEFRETGFLQEANRQFFHPHGLAMEITIVDEEGWSDKGKFIQTIIDRGVSAEDAIAALNLIYPPGSEFISGIWDDRDDPEGVWFDWPVWQEDWFDEPNQPLVRALRVAEERRKHIEPRTAMLDKEYGVMPREGGADIEPYLWQREDQ
jgi:hypothetical protein